MANATGHPTGRNSPALSSSSVGENRSYSSLDERLQRGSVSPTGSVTSIHDANFLNDRIRCVESEKLALMIDHNNLIREFNKRMESHLEEIRNLKEVNQQIEQESNELRDLCCFLDDDRQKCRKLAKEWQRFGKHTVAVMRTEVMSYQEKLHSLETRQAELIKENGELRDLCVYLDNQRTGTVSNEENLMKYMICSNCSALKKDIGESKQELRENQDYGQEHVTHLQNQIIQLEREKDQLHKLLMYGGKSRRDKKRVSFSIPTDDEYDSSSTTSEVERLDFPPSFESTENVIRAANTYNESLKNGFLPAAAGRNKAKVPLTDISPRNSDVTRLKHGIADYQVIEIREKLSKTLNEGESPSLSEQEIAVLKDMCNVVTQKTRTDSNTSLSSLNTSLDLASPISPPPSTIGVPLYRKKEPQAASSMGQRELEERSTHLVAHETRASTSETLYEEPNKELRRTQLDDLNDIDLIVESINTSIQQLDRVGHNS